MKSKISFVTKKLEYSLNLTICGRNLSTTLQICGAIHLLPKQYESNLVAAHSAVSWHQPQFHSRKSTQNYVQQEELRFDSCNRHSLLRSRKFTQYDVQQKELQFGWCSRQYHYRPGLHNRVPLLRCDAVITMW